jgi:hypothetical protein
VRVKPAICAPLAVSQRPNDDRRSGDPGSSGARVLGRLSALMATVALGFAGVALAVPFSTRALRDAIDGLGPTGEPR